MNLKNSLSLGIIQGRLSPPKEGFQECPSNWEKEFHLLNNLGLNHIEWIVTKEHFSSNPIFHKNISPYPISSVCADFMVDNDFCSPKYLSHYLKVLCEAVTKNNIKCVTIPLLENSAVRDKFTREKFINEFYFYAKKYPHINFLVEAELDQDSLKELLAISQNIFVTYDTGNITSCGFNHKDYILSLGDSIKHVHLKDRTIQPLKTVEPSTGDTDFKVIFKALKEIKFKGLYTLQTARGLSGHELKTIKRHKKIIEKFYNEFYI